MTALVATSELSAARAGADVLARGGNAVDAAVATAACLTVTEPTSNGLGGDCFALVHDGRQVHALASSGAAPAALDAAALRAEHDRMPVRGWAPVTVPGQVAGWGALLDRLGTWSFDRVLQPAIALATQGFVVGPVTAAAWARAVPHLQSFDAWTDTFLRDGRPPSAGERFVAPDHATTLSRLAGEGPRGLYEGHLAARIAAGGWLSEADLAAHRPRWETPLALRWRGWQVLGMPEPTQGVVALEALALLADTEATVHDQIEAIKIAFADAYATVADPEVVPGSAAALLDPGHLVARRALLGATASPPPPPSGIAGGTVLLCVDDGTMQVSLIQSNYMGFGSGIVVPGTGIALQNRGAGFVLEPGHPNTAAPGKRPFHTILPGLILDDAGGPLAAFGCMGGQMQPQGHVQLVTALRDGVAPPDAVARPRWRWTDRGELWLESGFDDRVASELRDRGHPVRCDAPPTAFGGAQIVLRSTEGPVGGSDPRKDGGVVAVPGAACG